MAPSDAAQRVRSLTTAAMAGAARAARPGVPAGEEDPPRRRRRWALTPRTAAAAGAVLLVVAVVALAQGLLGRSAPPAVVVPRATAASIAVDGTTEDATERDAPSDDVPSEEVPSEDATGEDDGAGGGAGAAQGPSAAVVVVHVAGHVGHPGVVELPGGSRLADALAAAGGPTGDADLAAVNLARAVLDGEQVYVPGVGDGRPPAAWSGAGGPGAGDASEGGGAPVDLNAAAEDALDALPGIGPVLAARILAWRTEHGRFTSVDELGEVAGIGPALLERLRPLVTV